MPALARRLPWIALLLTVLTAAALLFGPLWDTAEGENPLERPSGVNWELVLRLGLPTVMVLGALIVALALPRVPLLAGLGVLLFGYAVVQAPEPLAGWFLPALTVTAAAVVLGIWERRRGSAAARD